MAVFPHDEASKLAEFFVKIKDVRFYAISPANLSKQAVLNIANLLSDNANTEQIPDQNKYINEIFSAVGVVYAEREAEIVGASLLLEPSDDLKAASLKLALNLENMLEQRYMKVLPEYALLPDVYEGLSKELDDLCPKRFILVPRWDFGTCNVLVELGYTPIRQSRTDILFINFTPE